VQLHWRARRSAPTPHVVSPPDMLHARPPLDIYLLPFWLHWVRRGLWRQKCCLILVLTLHMHAQFSIVLALMCASAISCAYQYWYYASMCWGLHYAFRTCVCSCRCSYNYYCSCCGCLLLLLLPLIIYRTRCHAAVRTPQRDRMHSVVPGPTLYILLCCLRIWWFWCFGERFCSACVV